MQNRLGKPDLLKPALKQSTQDERVRLGFTPDETLKRTGKLRDSIEDGELSPNESGVGTASPYAIYHEMGGAAKDRPPKRSFLALTAREGDRRYFIDYVNALKRALGF